MNRNAFTIIELLVVVTVIVVLLALLTPAMDRAIYQAELLQCGAQLKAIASGATLYASEYNRHYPDRPTPKCGGTLVVDIARCAVDDRPVMQNHIPLDAFLDPFVKPVGLDTHNSGWIQSPFYTPWFSTKYPGHQGMRKIGDRFTWDDVNTAGEVFTRKLDFLASDTDARTDQSNGTYYTSHPDTLDVMRPIGDTDVSTAIDTITFSYFQLSGGVDRGTIESNYAYADGSVLRVEKVALQDSRMTTVPFYNDATNAALWTVQLPIRGAD